MAELSGQIVSGLAVNVGTAILTDQYQRAITAPDNRRPSG